MLKMLMHDYAAKSYIKVDDVRGGPIRGTIKEVNPGDYGRPVIMLEDGRRFSVNKKNTSILIGAFGEDGRDWSGCQIELVLGKTTYQGTSQDSVIVEPVSPPAAADGKPLPPKPKKAASDDFDAEVPFP